MLRRSINNKREKQLFIKRFYPAGTYTWTVPAGCEEVDVFLVGGGGYTKTFKSSTDGWRDGPSIIVIPGQSVEIIVGEGGRGVSSGLARSGGYSQFMNSNYRANGGIGGSQSSGGNGGSGGGPGNGGSDGSDGDVGNWTDDIAGKGQGHTTRDFGELTANRNSGGGSGQMGNYIPGASDYTEGKGMDGQGSYHGMGGGGYGGGGGAYYGTTSLGGNGGDGTVLIRYYAYKE